MTRCLACKSRLETKSENQTVITWLELEIESDYIYMGGRNLITASGGLKQGSINRMVEIQHFYGM